MATTVKSEVSKRNKYYISKDRFLELKHFCLQYPEWKRAYDAIGSINTQSFDIYKNGTLPDPTPKCVEAREKYYNLMKMVETAAVQTDDWIAPYILRAVTLGIPYQHLAMAEGLPCCRETYYDRYRKFFWILSQMR